MRGFNPRRGTLHERFWAKVDTSAGPDACWLWLGARSRSYGSVRRRPRAMSAHRYALEVALGRPVAVGMDACHTCDVRLCCNPAHLSEGTRLENMRDCARKGRTRRTPTVWGETHHKAKLSSAQVADIRDALARGEGYGPIACRHGVRNEVIGCIARGETWMQRMAA